MAVDPVCEVGNEPLTIERDCVALELDASVAASRPCWANKIGGPLRFLLIVGSFAIVIALFFAIDTPLVRAIQDLFPEDTWQRRVLRLAKWPLSSAVSFALIALLLIHPLRLRLILAFLGVHALAIGSLHLLKPLVGRARPDQHLGPFFFQPFGDPHLGFDSFPSGHMVQVVLTALLLQRYLPRLCPVPMLLAGMVALSRVAQARHYASDVVAGVMLSVAAFELVHSFFGRDLFPALTRGHLAEGWEQVRLSASRIVRKRPRE